MFSTPLSPDGHPDGRLLSETKAARLRHMPSSSGKSGPSDSDILPPPPEWKLARFFPGGYSKTRQIPLKGKRMVWAVNIIAGIAIMFYGYDQGVMSGVNRTPDYQYTMAIFSQLEPHLDIAIIESIVAVYYGDCLPYCAVVWLWCFKGTLIGALIAGSLGDRIGRIRTILFGCLWATVGMALQSSAQDITWMCCGRVITGIGTGQLIALVPVWISELSHQSGRGAAMGVAFTLNIAGLATASWIEFFLRSSNQSLRWRLPLALQIVFVVVLLIFVPLLPESPRWLAKMGREDEARHILSILRHNDRDSEEDELKNQIEHEFQGILETVQDERRREPWKTTSYLTMLFRTDPQHLRRRTWLTIWLQIMRELVGIGVVPVYALTVFRQAGYSEYQADLLSGINNLSYMLGACVAIVTLDRVGRRVTLYWGAIVMGVALLVAGVAARYAPAFSLSFDARYSWGAVVMTCTFVYTATFGATWLTVPWLVPTEIMPLHARAKGGCWSVVGWSISNAVVTEVSPFLWETMTAWAFFLFAILNLSTIPIIYFFYPETNAESLEDINCLF